MPPPACELTPPGRARGAWKGTKLKDAVVLMAYGSPSRPEDIPAYFSDIRGGRPIPPEAVAELTERYRRIGGSSPLNEITERQRAALEDALGVPVHVGMKHWTPRIQEAADLALAGGAERVVGLVLAPHYSGISIGGYRDRLEEALQGRAEFLMIESWHDHEPYLEILAARIRGTDANVVFTAHSLPARILDEGDPYRDQLLETSRLVAERAGVRRWSFAFQSASPTGEPWLGPDIVDEVERLHGEGVEKILVAPVGFVSDHLEILWDIDVEAREKAAELGLDLDRIESLNDSPEFIRALANLVEQVLREPSRIEAR
jgi:protoporphyrin/coproporphyrin ferrochelatase